MSEPATTEEKKPSADWFVRGALARLGDLFDKFVGRDWQPAGSLSTSGLVERMKRLMDAEAKDLPGKGRVVPHNITLKMEWDKFSMDSERAIESLRTELLVAAADHINDSLYYTLAPVTVDISADYFTEGVKIYVGFDRFADTESGAEMNVTIPAFKVEESTADEVAVEQTERHLIANVGSYKRQVTVPQSGRLSIGRAAANDLTLDDPSVSKNHASLLVGEDGALSVADTGSTNGTSINGTRMSYGQARKLEDGDLVRFGEVEVSFEVAAVS